VKQEIPSATDEETTSAISLMLRDYDGTFIARIARRFASI